MTKFNREKRIVVFSSVDINHNSKTVHNILLSYLLGFVRDGYVIDLALTSRAVPGAHQLPEEVAEKVNIERLCWAEATYRLPMFFLNIVKKLRKKYSPCQQASPENREKDDIWSNQQSEVWHLPYLTILTIQFLLYMVKRRNRTHFIYSVEPKCSVAGGAVGRVLGVPNISRIMGSALYYIDLEMQNRWKSYIKYPIRHISLSRLSPFHVMTNDGTRGLKALLDHGVKEKDVLFKTNGATKNFQSFISSMRFDSRVDAPFFVTISRLVNWKRVDRCIALFKAIIDSGADHNTLKLFIIGDGPEFANLKKHVSALGIEDRVVFLGRRPHEQALAVMQTSLAVMSLYNYSNLTNQVLEGVMANVPVITYSGSDVSSILHDGENSILLSRDEPLEDSAKKIESQLANDANLAGLKEKAARINSSLVQSWESRMKEEIGWIEGRLYGGEDYMRKDTRL